MLTLADATHVLKETFGFTQFREGQADVIEKLMQGRSAAAVFPTGQGKSLCYQLPALMLEGLTLVVSPLLALMKDQVDKLVHLGIAARRLDSTLTSEEVRAVLQQLRAKQLRMLFVAPERFNNELFRETLRDQRISLFAIDEAHCISEWGHNFRPDYLKLVRYARALKAERVLALTATATPTVLSDIAQQFELEEDCLIRTGSYRANLTLQTTPVATSNKARELVQRIKSQPSGSTVIYVTLQQTANGIAKYLQAAGFDARAYHAGMKDPERQAVQEWFLQSEEGIVVATIAFGMGIDKSNIRYIYHYNLPKTLENYSQEVGRAGRDGQEAICELFVSYDDLPVLENFIFGNTPTRSSILSLLRELFVGKDEVELSLYHLSQQTDIGSTVLRTLLAYLELLEFLKAKTPVYSEYRLQLLRPLEELLGRFPSRQRTFLKSVFDYSRSGVTWYTLNVPHWQSETGHERDRLLRAFTYLQENNWIEVQPAGLINRYRVCKAPESLEELTSKLGDYCEKRENSEKERLQKLLNFIRSPKCQNSYLQQYFGETTIDSCGHCSRCFGDQVETSLRRIPDPKPPQEICQKALEFKKQHPELGEELRPITRILCGVRSPRINQLKLHQHPLFGTLSSHRFSTVLQTLHTMHTG